MNINAITSAPLNADQYIFPKVFSKDLLHQKFIEAALALDVSIVEPYIPEDMKLQDLDKYAFLFFLNEHFEVIWHKFPEDWRVELADYTCTFCERGKPLASFAVFSGCELMPYAKFAYFVETDSSGETMDIFICNSFIKTKDFIK